MVMERNRDLLDNGSGADKSSGAGQWSLVKVLTAHQIASYYIVFHYLAIQ